MRSGVVESERPAHLDRSPPGCRISRLPASALELDSLMHSIMHKQAQAAGMGLSQQEPATARYKQHWPRTPPNTTQLFCYSFLPLPHRAMSCLIMVLCHLSDLDKTLFPKLRWRSTHLWCGQNQLVHHAWGWVLPLV